MQPSTLCVWTTILVRLPILRWFKILTQLIQFDMSSHDFIHFAHACISIAVLCDLIIFIGSLKFPALRVVNKLTLLPACSLLLLSYLLFEPTLLLCGGATGISHSWNSIEGHICGRYKELQLWRYSHYYNQFKAHTDSLKLEATLQDRLQQKIVILEAKNLESRDFSWVTDGFNRLFRSRRILSYSYPFAYYMFGDDLFKNKFLCQV
ncbi:unnamed protein product [Coffea canephora]|uniref:DH200=94 genomic scaffold, scaffold_188 n=1 Tax=Coffea canephora TaxID=49390 RepID=A0A068VAN3_COFCA|nr:unnamed protein product [Coffea canephora]